MEEKLSTEAKDIINLYENGTKKDKKLAFILACKYGHLDIVKRITDQFQFMSDISVEALCEALYNEHYDIFKYLANRGALIGLLDYSILDNIDTEDKFMNILKCFREVGFYTDTHFECFLCSASALNYLEVVKYLVGLNVNLLCHSPIYVASDKGNIDIVKYLVDRVVDKKNNNFRCILKWSLEDASKNSNIEIVEYLLSLEVSPKYVVEEFVQKYYIPDNIDNAYRLNNLKCQGIDITQLEGLTTQHINQLEETIYSIKSDIRTIPIYGDIQNIVMSYF